MLSLHGANSLDNADMAKYKTKPRVRGIYKSMKPGEVINQLKALGINTTTRTLQRYIEAGLIPMPERKSGGRGKGKIADYADETPEEFYASKKLREDISGIKVSVEKIAEAREMALEIDKNDGIGYIDWVFDKPIETKLAAKWREYRNEAKQILQG